MSDEEEESMSEGFSASEDEWKPTKDVRGGESSDDDDSDFEELPQGTVTQNHGTGAASSRKSAPPKNTVVKQTAIKKRKGAGQSLRTKLYNKYRPPPKTFPSPNSAGSNSPSASTSRTASKNVKMPNESGDPGNESSSESSVDDYLVNPEDIDFQSSFFNVRNSESKTRRSTSPPPPVFDCNIGIGKLSDSGSEDNNESSAEEQGNGKSFDFANLLDNVNSLERAKETIAKRAAVAEQEDIQTTGRSGKKCNTTVMDVNTLLALGEAQQSHANMRSMKSTKDDGEEEDDERDEIERGPQRLSKTKSTRVKRHTKTRPASTVLAGDTDDSDFEEVAEDTGSVSHSTTYDTSALLNTTEGLEIHVELPSKQKRNKEKKQQDLEMALKRKLNRDLKERFLHLHKTSLLCCFARSYRFNRMLNDTPLMQAALKLLPSSNAYPPERGTEIKYFQSMVTWYKTAVKLASPNLYGEKVRKSRRRVKRELLEAIRKKEASCKQDFAFIFVVLLRAMGLQCRLIVNMQPLPLRPAQTDLLTVKMKRDASEIKAEVERIGLEAKKSKVHGERTEKAGSKGEEKKRDRDKDKLSSRKAEKDRKKEKRVEDDLKNNKSDKKVVEKKESNAEKKEVVKDAHKERKRAPSAKLAEMIATQTEVSAGSRAKKAKTDAKESPQRSARSKEPRENANNEETTKSDAKLQLSDKEKATKISKTAQNALESKEIEGEEEVEKQAANNLKPPKEATVPKNAPTKKPTLARLKSKRDAAESETRNKLDLAADKPGLSVSGATPIARRTRKASTENQAINKAIIKTKSDKPTLQIGSPVLPKIVIQSGKIVHTTAEPNERENKPHVEEPPGLSTRDTRDTRSRSKSPKIHISPTFLQSTNYKQKFPEAVAGEKSKMKAKSTRAKSKSPAQKIQISTEFLKTQNANAAAEPIASGTRAARILRSSQKPNEDGGVTKMPQIPQLDGADDSLDTKKRPPQLKKLKKKQAHTHDESDEDFEPSPPKQPKKAPNLHEKKKTATKDKTKVDRRVLSSDDEESSGGTVKRNPTAADIWVEAWSDAEEQWICIELFKGKLHSVEAIRKAASSNFAYVFAFQNDLSIKDVTARYCSNWTTTVRKSRVERAWLEAAFRSYYGQRTQRDIREDQELRRIHEEKPMPTAIGDYKDHPLYALERHLLKFQAIYPPNPPTLGFVRGEAVYARECVHTLHSREIWLKQARTVKLGEQPYKIVKARPKWDRLTQTVIKDQPLEIFGYWQTEDYEPPTAENGIVPRNAYGNVELFKECMLPKKTVHLRLSGLNRICKKLGIDCAQAVTGFDFHQGACHPLYDGFVVCEEFQDQVTAAWYQDQEEQEKKEQDKYEARVYGNWKKLIKGLIIRERLKKKYNF